MPQYVRFASGSKEPVTQIGPPPCLQASGSPFHVSCPGSPGPGTVLKRHASLPVAASYAAMNPRIPNSPPPTPTITLSFTTSGACMIEYPASARSTLIFHASSPVLALIATRYASTVPMNRVLPRMASPRLLLPQQLRCPDGRCRYTQNTRPVAASS